MQLSSLLPWGLTALYPSPSAFSWPQLCESHAYIGPLGLLVYPKPRRTSSSSRRNSLSNRLRKHRRDHRHLCFPSQRQAIQHTRICHLHRPHLRPKYLDAEPKPGAITERFGLDGVRGDGTGRSFFRISISLIGNVPVHHPTLRFLERNDAYYANYKLKSLVLPLSFITMDHHNVF